MSFWDLVRANAVPCRQKLLADQLYDLASLRQLQIQDYQVQMLESTKVDLISFDHKTTCLGCKIAWLHCSAQGFVQKEEYWSLAIRSRFSWFVESPGGQDRDRCASCTVVLHRVAESMREEIAGLINQAIARQGFLMSEGFLYHKEEWPMQAKDFWISE